jgi:hypothetical protein
MGRSVLIASLISATANVHDRLRREDYHAVLSARRRPNPL